MTTDDFANAASQLRAFGVSLRVFVLICPPFVPPNEQDAWLLASVAFAEDCGASVISLIPTRAGNGAMEALTAQRLFVAPTRADITRSFDLVRSQFSSRESRAPRILLDPWIGHAR